MNFLNLIEDGIRPEAHDRARLYEIAHLLVQQSIGNALFYKDRPSLRELLTTCKAGDDMNNDQLTGLCFAMVAVGGRPAENLAIFLKDLSDSQKSTVLDRLVNYLAMLYGDKKVVQWMLFSHAHLTPTCLELARYLSKNKEEFSYDLLQANRITKRPENTKNFIRICNRLFNSRHKDILNENLRIHPQ